MWRVLITDYIYQVAKILALDKRFISEALNWKGDQTPFSHWSFRNSVYWVEEDVVECNATPKCTSDLKSS